MPMAQRQIATAECATLKKHDPRHTITSFHFNRIILVGVSAMISQQLYTYKYLHHTRMAKEMTSSAEAPRGRVYAASLATTELFTCSALVVLSYVMMSLTSSGTMAAAAYSCTL